MQKALILSGIILLSVCLSDRLARVFNRDSLSSLAAMQAKASNAKNSDDKLIYSNYLANMPGVPGLTLCNGIVFDTFPTFDGFENKKIVENLNKVAKVTLEKTFQRTPYYSFSDDIQRYIFADFKNDTEKNEAYFKYNVSIDSEKITWSPVAVLPANGKFIMVILAYLEKDVYEPASRGFYLSTFSLKGKMLSMAYIYSYEDIDYSKIKDKLNIILGRAYCLNTNRPIIRKVVNWDVHNRGGIWGITLEVTEIEYLINEEGYIHKENEKIIFPKTDVQWKDRDKVSFGLESDTIRKLLGEIE